MHCFSLIRVSKVKPLRAAARALQLRCRLTACSCTMVLFLSVAVMPAGLSGVRPRASEAIRILSLGDSITEGFIDGAVNDESRYTTLLERVLDESGRPAQVMNRAYSGQVSTRGALDIAGFLSTDDPDVVTALYGANDMLLEDGGVPNVSPENFGEALRAIVKEVRAERGIPVLLSPVPLIAGKFYERHDRELYERYGGIEILWQSYDSAARRVAGEEHATLVDLELLMGDSLDILLGSDGVHPSVRGHEVIANELFRVISTLDLPGETEGDTGGEGTISDCYAYPNPYRPSGGALLKLHIRLAGGGRLGVRVLDITGRGIARIQEVTIAHSGEHWLVWDGKDSRGNPLAPGVYLLSIEWSPEGTSGQVKLVKKLAVLR
jgi:lysophospholipase L1-like esterase